jgi:hypothetical protein
MTMPPDEGEERSLLERLFVPSAAGDGGRDLDWYLDGGWRGGRDPNPWFSAAYYVAGLAGLDAAPLLHYVRHGAAEGRAPHPWFDAGWYARRHLDRRGGDAGVLAHFLEQGLEAGHVPHPALDRAPVRDRVMAAAPGARGDVLRAVIAEIEADLAPARLLVDAAWYRATYPDVAAAGVDPTEHYLLSGWREGRDPNPWFQTRPYLDRYGAVAAEGICPLVHYARRGAAAGAEPCRQFRTAWYARRYLGDAPPEQALAHFLAAGLAAGHLPHPGLDRLEVRERLAAMPLPVRLPAMREMLETEDLEGEDIVSALVDPAWYRARHPGLGAADPVQHYLATGWKEGRDPNPWFSTRFYLERNPAAAGAGGPLPHFVVTGAAAGRRPSAGFDIAWYARRFLGGAPPDAGALRHFLHAGLAAGLVPHPILDGPGLRDRLLATRPEERTHLIKGLLNLASRLRAAARSSAGERALLDVWFLRPLPLGATSVLLVAPESEPGGLRLARAAAHALLPGEAGIAAVATGDGGLRLAAADGGGEIVLALPADLALLRTLLVTTRCARTAFLARWPGDAALARTLRAAGTAVSIPPGPPGPPDP